MLSDAKKRRLFDSEDEAIDDSVPGICKDDKQFYTIFNDAFERNGRWLEQQPVPSLGDDSTPYEQVEDFYHFWYSAKSWREFGYHDNIQQELEQAESRDERRWIERQYRNERKKRKNEENARILRLIDNAYASDPRVRRHHEEQTRLKKEARRQRANALREAEEVCCECVGRWFFWWIYGVFYHRCLLFPSTR